MFMDAEEYLCKMHAESDPDKLVGVYGLKNNLYAAMLFENPEEDMGDLINGLLDVLWESTERGLDYHILKSARESATVMLKQTTDNAISFFKLMNYSNEIAGKTQNAFCTLHPYGEAKNNWKDSNNKWQGPYRDDVYEFFTIVKNQQIPFKVMVERESGILTPEYVPPGYGQK